MRHTVSIHDLGATELQVRGVDLAAEQIVEGGSTREDDRLTLNLDSTLTEADKVGANTWCGLVKCQGNS